MAGLRGAELTGRGEPPACASARRKRTRPPSVQAFEELLPWHRFSLRLKQADIPRLPEILDSFPDASWYELRRNLACVWPRVLWLQADNEAPGEQASNREAATKASHLAMLGSDAVLSGYDAWESVMHTLKRRVASRKGLPPADFDWRTPASSCKAVMGQQGEKSGAAIAGG